MIGWNPIKEEPLNLEAEAHFEVLVCAECTLRAIRYLMKVEGYDLSELEDAELIRKMLKVLENTEET